MRDIAVKTAVVVLAVCMCGCTIGRLHASLVDLNKAEASAYEDAPPKPAAQLNFQWDFQMTYFLEKTYELDDDGHLVASRYYSTLIRPCEWEYSKILDWHAKRLSRKDDALTLGGQVASFNDNLSQDSRHFDSIEEWMIWLELNKGIVPDFEDTRIQTRDHLKEYIAKSIDLRTNKVLFDAMADTIELVKKLDFRCRS